MIEYQTRIAKILTVILLTGALVLFGVNQALAAKEQVVTLKNNIAVDDDYIRVGNVFDNAGDYASHPLAPTPETGKSLVLNEADITRIAKAFNFKWEPSLDKTNSITFTRNATRIDLDSMKKILGESALKNNVGNDFDILFDPEIKPLDVKGKDVSSFSTQNIQYNPITERFSATIYAFDSEQNILGQQTINGNAVKMITIPTLSTRTLGGTIINENDITPLRIREKDLAGDVLINSNNIIGMSPRRTLSALTPLMKSDLTFPRIVKKNELITLSLQKGTLSLSAKGRALSDGAKGDTISVLNTSSNKVIEAVVVSVGNAIVPTENIN